MNKILICGLTLVMLVALAGCAKQNERPGDLAMSDMAVKSAVSGWKVYTNPAFRYELRYPQNWAVEDSGEDGVTARFFESKKAGAMVKIVGYSNWQDKLDLAGFYAGQSVDLLKSDAAREEIELDGKKAIWFKDVKGRVAPDANQLVDVVAIDAGNRIVEIDIVGGWDKAKALINSLYFYPDKVISDL